MSSYTCSFCILLQLLLPRTTSLLQFGTNFQEDRVTLMIPKRHIIDIFETAAKSAKLCMRSLRYAVLKSSETIWMWDDFMTGMPENSYFIARCSGRLKNFAAP
jgi:hypothetical protein